MSERDRKTNFIVNAVYYAIIIFIAVLFIKYLLGPLLPFIFAFIIVSSSRKIVRKVEIKSGSKKYASIIFTLILILLLSLTVYGIFIGVFKELTKLSGSLSDDGIRGLTDSIYNKFNMFSERFSESGLFYDISAFLSKVFDSFDKTLSDAVSASLPSLIAFSVKFISFFPSAVIFLCFLFISVFYISCDYEKICEFLVLQLPERAKNTIDETMSIISSTAKELFKSYFLLTLITFLQLLVGFMIMGIDYALLLAGIICFVDLLPILGTGTVLIPWSVICFLLEDYPTAIGLIVLYASITLFRQIAEPRIVGANTGLSPLLSLISIFLGLKLMGFMGIIIFPIIVITIVSLNKKGLIKLYKNFPEKSGDKILKTKIKFLNFKRHDNK